MTGILFGSGVVSELTTVIYQVTLNAEGGANFPDSSLRQDCDLTANHPVDDTHIRVTLEAGVAGAFVLNHASIGISVNLITPGETTLIPSTLMFDGSPAVSISAGNQRASDWLVLSGSSLAAGFTTTSILTVVMDTATDGNMRVKSTGLSGANQIVLIAGEQTYNMKDGWAGGSPFTGRCHCVAKIETKGGTIETTPDVPVIVTPPTLSPTTAIAGGGIVITCGTGSWTFSPTLFVYQWMRNGVDIAGATGNTYTTIVADDGTTVSCKVRSGNGAGPSAGYENTSNSCAVGGGSGGSSWIMGDGTWGDTDVWDDAGVWVD